MEELCQVYSRVINDSGYVSDKTRKKVEDVIAELNYKPNELARNLFRNRTNIVAVITPAIGNPYYATLCSKWKADLESMAIRQCFAILPESLQMKKLTLKCLKGIWWTE